jgi:hypothetical protein
MTAQVPEQFREISIGPHNRLALWRLFTTVGAALLDEIVGENSGDERIVADIKTLPEEGYWPHLYQNTRVLQQGGIVVNIWAWYEITNPRDGDIVGAGGSVVLSDTSQTFSVSGEDGGQQLTQVTAVGKNITQNQFEDWTALFQFFEVG